MTPARPTKVPGEVGDDYYERVAQWSSTERYGEEMTALLDRFDLPAGASVLDVGCGTGAAMRLAATRGLRTTGIDRPGNWPRHCTSRPVVRGDVCHLPFRAGSFDGALLFHVLVHLESVKDALGEVYRVLRSHGRIALSTPNPLFLETLRHAPPAREGYVRDPTVRCYVTAERTQELLSSSGFRLCCAAGFDPSPIWGPRAPFAERLFFVAERDGRITSESSEAW